MVSFGSTGLLARADGPAAPPPWQEAQDLIPEFSPVFPGDDSTQSPKIFRGPRPSQDHALEKLKIAGVNTVINLQGGDGDVPLIGRIVRHTEKGEKPQSIFNEGLAAKAAKITNYLNRPLLSYASITPDEGKIIADVLDVMGDERYQPVYVHCEHGHDRTGMIVALYRVRYESYSMKKAHDEMIAKGHKGFLNHLFTHAMDEYFYEEGCRIKKQQRLENPALAEDPACAPKKYIHATNKKGAELLMEQRRAE